MDDVIDLADDAIDGLLVAHSRVMSLRRLYLLLLALCCFGLLIEALVAWPTDVVAIPADVAPSWAPRDRPPRPSGFQPEFTREQAPRA